MPRSAADWGAELSPVPEGAMRIGPRLSLTRTETDAGVTQLLYVPYAHLDYQRNGRIFEVEGRAELGPRPIEVWQDGRSALAQLASTAN